MSTAHVQRQRGLRALQFNFVTGTNGCAPRTSPAHDLQNVGRLPPAFRHSRLYLVDVGVTYRALCFARQA